MARPDIARSLPQLVKSFYQLIRRLAITVSIPPGLATACGFRSVNLTLVWLFEGKDNELH